MQLDGESLSQGLVKHRIAGRVREVGEHDRVRSVSFAAG
jgi:hypothetical protein